MPDPLVPLPLDSKQDAKALTGLLSLLTDLELVEPLDPPLASDIAQSEPDDETPAGCTDAQNGAAVPPPAPLDFEPLDCAIAPPQEIKVALTVAPPIQATAVDDAAAFEQLQRLLVDPKLAEFRPIVESLGRKLAQIEHQLYDPAELINLLLPCMAELLNRKIAESQDEVVQAIAPIIDQIIENRVKQDSLAMSTAIAPLIAAAISSQSAHSPQEMAAAIAPTMGRAIKEQIVLERDAMVDALYPVIGSTIAKYMAETVQAINQQIETAFSIKGLRRKITARLQGVSESELILKEAMPCEVQAVFLIHKVSGLVISEVQLHEGKIDPAGVGDHLESELIAGMLTAIRSFANDCMTQPHPSELNQIDYGGFRILLEVAGYCYLAIAIQGNPPQRFLTAVRQTLEGIVQLYSTEIEQFEGDSATVPAPVPELLVKLGCTDVSEPTKPNSPIALLLGGLVLSAIVLPWGYFHHQSSIRDQIQLKTIAALAHAPDLAIYRLNVEADRQTLHLSGQVPNQHLRQRAEQIAESAAPNWAIDNQVQAVEVPADPILAAAEVDRVTAILNQIEGATITATYESGKVAVAGTVSQAASVQQITQAFEQIPGVRSIATAIRVQPLPVNVRFYFGTASAEVLPIDLKGKLSQVKAQLDRNPTQVFLITGYSNPVNGARETQRLALQRAKAIRAALMQQGVPPDRLQLAGLAQYPSSSAPNQPAWFGQYVGIKPLVSVSQP